MGLPTPQLKFTIIPTTIRTNKGRLDRRKVLEETINQTQFQESHAQS